MRRFASTGPWDLPGREVHVWVVRLEASQRCLSQSLAWLPEDETARAGRFRFDPHRRAFILGRAALRWLLGRYLSLPPAQIRFTYAPQGKPALADRDSPLCFNTSNSGNLAAYAFTEGCEIGVDVEQSRTIHELENVARRFFAPEEAAELIALPEADRCQGFFNCWTRKEAYIKATGDGLSAPLGSFRVTLRPGAAAQMLCLGGSVEAARCWTLQDFVPAPDSFGALAYRDQPRRLAIQPVLSAEELLGR